MHNYGVLWMEWTPRLFAILLIAWYSLNQVEDRLRHQAVDTLELVLESTHDNLHKVWLDGQLRLDASNVKNLN